nr:hypothetical protein [Streptomyces niphimycinicus]
MPVVVGMAVRKNANELLVMPEVLVTLTETWPEHGAELGTVKMTVVAVTVVGVTGVEPKFTLAVVDIPEPLMVIESPGLP